MRVFLIFRFLEFRQPDLRQVDLGELFFGFFCFLSSFFLVLIKIKLTSTNSYLNALRAYTATVPMTQYDVPEVSRRFRPHLPLHFAIQIPEK